MLTHRGSFLVRVYSTWSYCVFRVFRGTFVEVTLTIENGEGEQGHVSAVGADYTDALTKARALIPEDCKAIVIRTDS